MMNRAIIIVVLITGIIGLSACSSEPSIEEEVSHVTDEGPYGGHSVAWYKAHWNAETNEQRRWCRQQQETEKPIKSCLDAQTGWQQGRADPKTNPPRRWEDGPSPNK